MERSNKTKYNLRNLDRNSAEESPAAKRQRRSDEAIAGVDDHVNRLPNKLLSKIFEYCTQPEVARSVLVVCKRWNEIGTNGPLFRRYLKFGSNGTTEDILETVAKSTTIKALEIHNRKDFGLILSNVGENGTSVEELRLKMCASPPSIYHGDLFDGCSRLKQCCDTVGCIQYIPRGGVICTTHCDNMIPSFPNLKKLTLINITIQGEKFFNDIGSILKSLTSLTILYCKPGIASDDLRLITENCTLLSHVSILQKVTHKHIATEGFVSDWDAAYQNLVLKRGGQLQALEFDAQLTLDGDALSALLAPTRLLALHTLSIEHAWHLPDEGFVAISGLHSLKHLHLHYCRRLTERTMTLLFAPGKLGALETLSVPWCCRVTDRCLEIISEACPQLRKLDLSFCSDITDEGMEALIKRCTDLRYLILLKTGGIRGSSFCLIPTATPSLRDLVVEEGNASKEQFLKDVEARCPDLRVSRVEPTVEF